MCILNFSQNQNCLCIHVFVKMMFSTVLSSSSLERERSHKSTKAHIVDIPYMYVSYSCEHKHSSKILRTWSLQCIKVLWKHRSPLHGYILTYMYIYVHYSCEHMHSSHTPRTWPRYISYLELLSIFLLEDLCSGRQFSVGEELLVDWISRGGFVDPLTFVYPHDIISRSDQNSTVTGTTSTANHGSSNLEK